MQWYPKFIVYKGFPTPSKDEQMPCFLTLCMCVCVCVCVCKRERERVEGEREDSCVFNFL